MEKWGERAEELKISLEQERKREAIRAREEEKRYREKRKQEEKDFQLVVKSLSPRVAKVCKAFSRAMGGYLGGGGEAGHFEVIGGPLEYGRQWQRVEVGISIWGVSLATEHFNDSLLSKYHSSWVEHRSDSENLPSRWESRQVYHLIPISIFNEDRLAEILEEFCGAAFSPKAKHESRDE